MVNVHYSYMYIYLIHYASSSVPSCPQRRAMKITLISVAVVACLVWQLQDVDGNRVSSLGRIISEPAKVV